jgi:pyruvate dehydrogenase E2 component (dihydrolipoamide acetyltransferase)
MTARIRAQRGADPMPINITMPALSPTMEEGNLAKWLVKVGDQVSAGDVIAEIETDKATMEVEAVDEGVVARILVDAGTEGVKVNDVIAVLAEEGEDADAVAKAGGGEAPAAKTAEPAGEPAAETAEPPEAQRPPPDRPPAAPASGPAPEAGGARVFSSPLARRLAGEGGVDIASIKGSGPHGRVIKRDVESAMAKGVAAAETPARGAAKPAAPAAMADEQVLRLFEQGSYELKPHDNMRKTIARRLVEAKSSIPHFYMTIDCEIDALLALRQQLNDAAPLRDDQPAYRLSVNDMIIKAMAMALQAIPAANASWTEANMVMHKHSDVGVAVSIPGGLITPIIRKAESKTLSAISNEMKDLARRARERKLKPEEYQGGTTAVSNLGMFGVKDFSAVINPPHATILAVGAGEKRAVVKNDSVQIATIMSATLSTDHRAVDGALGAELLAAFRNFVEKPFGMLV